MRRRGPTRIALWLGLVLLLGAAVRVPGLFWGYWFFGTEVVVLHPDEPPYAFGRGPTTTYPRGLEVQVGLLYPVFGALGLTDFDRRGLYDLLVGRIPSLVYGVLTLLVVFRLGRALFGDARIGLLAAFFLALADLHVTYSHIAIPDSPATFWFYAALALAHTALTRESRGAAALAAVASGVAAAMRYQSMSLVPLLWWALRSRPRVRNGLLVLGTFLAAFYLSNGLSGDPVRMWSFVNTLAGWGNLGSKKLAVPLVYLAVLLVGVGLPVFLLAGYGLIRLARDKVASIRHWRGLLADNEIPVLLAPVAAFGQLPLVSLWAHRHAVVVVPFVAMLAAYGFARLPLRAVGPLSVYATRRALLAAIGIYLAVQVASVQAYFVDDPLEKAGRWLRARVPQGVVLSTVGAYVPPEYPTTAEWKASYLVLSGRAYWRYLVKDFLPAHLTGRYPDFRQVFGGNRADAERIQRLFRGELPYHLVKRVRLRFFTPELLLSHTFWYPPPHLDEVLIYERRREREIEVGIPTPAPTDYLVTLEMGPLWRPEPDQRITALLEGEPVSAHFQTGLTHLLVSRSRVVIPRSRLRFVSDRPLPLVPPDLVRVRPVGEEFGVDAAGDEDLLAEGFHGPEQAEDGRGFRWSKAVGRVTLPGPGSGAVWRRLSVHLAGRRGAGARPQPVVFFLDGRRVGETVVSAEKRTVDLSLPPGVFAGDVAELDLVTLPWRPSEILGTGDSRELGVAVYWVRLRRAPRPPGG